MTEEKKSKAPIVVGVCFAVAACAAIGLLILRKRYPWLKEKQNIDNASDVEVTESEEIVEQEVETEEGENDECDDDIVVDSSEVEVSDDTEKEEVESEAESSYEKLAEAVEPLCSPLVKKQAQKKRGKIVVVKKPELDVVVDNEAADEKDDTVEPTVVAEEPKEQVIENDDFAATAESMKEAETATEEIVADEAPTMVEPPAVEIPEFTEEQIKEANDFVAEMKSKEPEFNQIFMVPVADETIEVYGFGVCAALLVSSGSDETGEFKVRALINRQGMPSEVKVYGDNAKGFKVFVDMDEAKTFFQNVVAAATAIKATPESFEESKKILLQVLAEDVTENP